MKSSALKHAGMTDQRADRLFSPLICRRTAPLLAAGALLAAGLPSASAQAIYNGGNANFSSGFTPAVVNGGTLLFTSNGPGTANNDLSGLSLSGLTFDALASAYTLTGNGITLTGNLVNSSPNNEVVSLALGGTGGLTQNGSGTLTLNSVNTFTGDTNITSGIVAVSGTGKLYGGGFTTGPTVTVGTGATLQLAGWTYDALGSLGDLDFNQNRLVVNGGTIEYTGPGNTNTGNDGRNFTVGVGGATLKASGSGTWYINVRADYGNLVDNTSLTLAGAGNGETSKVISGTGSLTKNDAGTWTLDNVDTYSGATTVNGGTLILNNNQPQYGSVPNSNVTVNSGGTLAISTDNALIGYNNGGTSVTVNAGGTLTTLNGASTHTGNVTLNGGTLASSGSTGSTSDANYGSFDVQNGGTISATANSTITANNLLLEAGSAVNVASGVNLTDSGTIVLGGQLTLNGSGTLTLTNSNTYTGGTTVNGGNLVLDANQPQYGTVQGGIVINNGGTVTAANSNAIIGYANGGTTITVNSGGLLTTTDNTTTHTGNVILAGGTLASGIPSSLYGSFDFVGTYNTGGVARTIFATANSLITATGIDLETGTSVDVSNGVTLTDSGTIGAGTTNDGQITKTDTGTLLLTGANTYTGSTTITAGTLQVGSGGATPTGSIAGTSSVTVGGGSTLIVANNAALNNAAAPVTLGDGNGNATVQNGFNGTPTTDGSGNVNTHNVQHAGTLSLGTGTSDILDFAGNAGTFDFAGADASFGAGQSLTIKNFGSAANETLNGATSGTEVGDYQLLFDTGLTSTQLADISFLNNDTTQVGATEQQLTSGANAGKFQVLEASSPAPEPAQAAALGVFGLGLGALILKARKKAAPKTA